MITSRSSLIWLGKSREEYDKWDAQVHEAPGSCSLELAVAILVLRHLGYILQEADPRSATNEASIIGQSNRPPDDFTHAAYHLELMELEKQEKPFDAKVEEQSALDQVVLR
ncbi:hypothetical protein FKW77_004019 [Venturia effusa]|uniref:Uncharacterized protein n=1 Tax=Venturia effusa TaxID=50376 RepID=A0A517LNQ9_9PEZI|nr:hypothetical protein FKW77_004019 [Venturia effusa]